MAGSLYSLVQVFRCKSSDHHHEVRIRKQIHFFPAKVSGWQNACAGNVESQIQEESFSEFAFLMMEFLYSSQKIRALVLPLD